MIRKTIAASAAMVCVCMLGANARAQSEWKPTRNVDIVVASAAGGSSDRTARVLQKLLHANPAFPSVSVTNRPGGGGTVAWTFLTQRPGDAHYIATFSPTMLTNQILGTSKLGHEDVTPLAILLREYIVFAVNASSPIKSAKELVERLRKDPASVSFAFATAAGNHNHVLIGMIVKAAGGDPRKAKVVIESSGGQATTAMLGGHIDVLVAAPANVIPHLQAGKARGIGISAPARQAGALAGVPTLREQGIDAAFFNWRGFVGPRGLTPQQTAFWDQAFARAIQGDEWKKDLASNAWAEDFMASAETRRHVEGEYELMKTMLRDLGVVSSK
jgi:putative tricarboxylic transport membrane protein